MLNFFRPFPSQLRDKWREVPVHDRRVYSSDLLKMDDDAFLKVWRENDATPTRGWYREHYTPLVKGKEVLDLGCGFSVDGIHFLRNGARVTFADIVQSNLDATRRLAGHFGLPAGYHYIDDIKRFRLPHQY